MGNNLATEQLIYTGEIKTSPRIYLTVYGGEIVEEYEADNFHTLVEKLKNDQINWVQVRGMSNINIVRAVCEYFEIEFLSVQDILNAQHPTKVEEHDKYTLLVLKIFQHKGEEELDQQQLSVIQGANFVLTFQESDSDLFHNIVLAIKNNVIKIRTRQTDYLLSVILNNVMSNYNGIISKIDDAMEDLEEELLSISKDRDIGIQIQLLRRQYMAMKRAIWPLKDQYVKILRADNKLIHKVTRAYFNDVNDHLQFILQMIDTCRETLSSLVDLYISNNDLRMNDIMKRLTVVSTIFIPLTFLVGVWGMNFDFMPELHWKYGYWVAWSLMATIAIAVYLFLKKKKWY